MKDGTIGMCRPFFVLWSYFGVSKKNSFFIYDGQLVPTSTIMPIKN